MDPRMEYECSACGTIHAHPTLAQQCCLPLVFEVYVCGKCKRKHGLSFVAAFDCCRPQIASSLPSFEFCA